jgi:hypothetical protein
MNCLDKEIDITVKVNQMKKLSVDLVQEPGSLLVKSVPEGASVELDGELKGYTTLTIDPCPAGQHRLKIFKKGYQDTIRTVMIKPHKGETVSVVLEEGETSQNDISAQSPSRSGKDGLDILGWRILPGSPKSLGVKFSIGALSPNDEEFNNNIASSLVEYSLSIDYANILSVSASIWDESVDANLQNRLGPIEDLYGETFEIALTVPITFYAPNDEVKGVIYYGGGGRFEAIYITESNDKETRLGNNAYIGTVGLRMGLKHLWPRRPNDMLGIDLNYSRSFKASLTNYDVIRAGLCYEFSLE